jgi:hypothetical protein
MGGVSPSYMKSPIRAAFLLATLATTSVAHAQVVGWRSGQTSSNVAWEADGCCTGWGNKSRESTTEMWSLRLDLHKHFAIESGRGSVRKGYNTTTPRIHATYDEVPLSLIAQTGPGTGFFAGVGVVFGRMTQCERTGMPSSVPSTPSCGENITSFGHVYPAIATRDLSRSVVFGARVRVWRFDFTWSGRSEKSIRDNDGAGGERMRNLTQLQMLGVEFRVR